MAEQACWTNVGFRLPQDESDGILRRLFGRRGAIAPVTREGVVIAVTSGKGGTGKSFLASNMAVALSRSGQRVVVVDCDFGLGNAHLLLGVAPRLTLQHVLGQRVPIEEALIRTPHGPWLVPAGSGISRLAELAEQELMILAQSLSRLAASHDVLVLDTAAGISPQSLLTLLLAEHVVLVTNPEIAALTDAYALIKCMARQPRRPRVSVVVNRVPRRGIGEITHEKLADVSGRFASCEIHYLGEIPDDPAVTQRRLGQPPLIASHPSGEASRCIQEIVEKLQRAPGGLRPRSPQRRGDDLMQRFRIHTMARARG